MTHAHLIALTLVHCGMWEDSLGSVIDSSTWQELYHHGWIENASTTPGVEPEPRLTERGRWMLDSLARFR